MFLPGMRHGFDADHLATIDGVTRLNQRRSKRVACGCGALFSLGHGAVAMLMAALFGSVSERWGPPAWMDGFGSAVSIGVMFGLGFINFRAVLTKWGPCLPCRSTP